ncbi:MAG: class I SAM-dependent methyltransferase [Myxococcota bacterium]
MRRANLAQPVDPLDAYRLVNGSGDEAYPGLVVDRYGEAVVVMARHQVPTDVVDAWHAACLDELSPRALVHKTVGRSAAERTSRLVAGTLPDAPIRVREGDAVFECRLNDGFQTGLFLDHRDTRQVIRQWSNGVEVLNLFAYTGAFSVHAALAGARRVTSVDSAKRALRWGRANMVASGLAPDAHRWFADDVLAHLRRGPSQQYGLIILDPPVMGRAGGKTFSLSQQLDGLLDGAVRKLAPGGVLVFSTHARRWTLDALRPFFERVGNKHGRIPQTLAELGLPTWDHPPGDDFNGMDRGAYLKTLVLAFA